MGTAKPEARNGCEMHESTVLVTSIAHHGLPGEFNMSTSVFLLGNDAEDWHNQKGKERNVWEKMKKKNHT